MKPRKYPNGQALVEFVISLIVIPIFFFGIIHLTQLMMVRVRLLQAARHGAWLISTGRVSQTTVRQEIQEFLANGTPKLDRSKIRNISFSLRQGPHSLDTVTVEYELKTLGFTDNFFKPIAYTNYRLRESATVGHVCSAGTPYLPPY